MTTHTCYKVIESRNEVAISLYDALPPERLGNDPDAHGDQIARMKRAVNHFARITGRSPIRDAWELFVDRTDGYCTIRF